jgi:hypothetical protein
VETLSFSANSSAMVELLNCILVGGFVPLLDESAMERLFRYVLFNMWNVSFVLRDCWPG